MSLLHPTRTAIPADCWQCDPTSDGPLCADHARKVREAATAQAQPGYGLPHPCVVCGELNIGDDTKHDHWSLREDDRHKRLADV